MTENKSAKKIKQFKAMALRDSRDRSILVEVKFLKIHPLYKKRYFKIAKMLVDTKMEIKSGDRLIIEECRKVSRKKAWQVVKVLK